MLQQPERNSSRHNGRYSAPALDTLVCPRTSGVRFGVQSGKPSLIVPLKSSTFREVARRCANADNVTVLQTLLEIQPGLLPDQLVRRLASSAVRWMAKAEGAGLTPGESVVHAAAAIRNLLRIAKGSGGDGNIGSGVQVVLEDMATCQTFTAGPPRPPAGLTLERRAYEIRAALSEDLQLLGVPAERIQEHLLKIEAATDLAMHAITLRQNGWSLAQIAATCDATPSRIQGWLSGSLPKVIADADPTFRKKYQKHLTVPRQESEPFAYLLGACSGATRSGPTAGRITFQDKDYSVIEHVRSALQVVTGDKELQAVPRIINGQEYFQVQYLSQLLSGYIRQLTDLNRRVPWEHLVTKQERRAFLRGLFDWHGSVSTRRLDLEKRDNPTLIRGVAVLCKQLQLFPQVKFGHRSAIIFTDVADLHRFKNEIGFVAEAKSIALDRLLQSGRERTAHTPKQYERAIAFRKENETLSRARIAKELGVSESVIRGWLEQGKVPKSVARLRVLEKLAEQEGNVDEIGRAFRGNAEVMPERPGHPAAPESLKANGTAQHPPACQEVLENLVSQWRELHFPEWSAEKLCEDLSQKLSLSPGVLRRGVFRILEERGFFKEADQYRAFLLERDGEVSAK